MAEEINIGSGNIDNIQLGSTAISNVRLGSTLIWESCGSTAFMMGATYHILIVDACASAADTQRWHNGIAAYPKNGDIVYDDCGITVHSGHATRVYNLGNGKYARIGVGTGIVSNIGTC